MYYYPATPQPLTWVQGEAGAKSYQVAPGQTVLLMDSERETFYIKSADTNGMPKPLRIFDYTARQEPETIDTKYVTIDDLKALESRLVALMGNIRKEENNERIIQGNAGTNSTRNNKV